MATNATPNNSSPNPMPDPQPTLTQTKTRTKAVVATLVVIIGLGIIAAVGAARGRRSGICDGGPRDRQPCRVDYGCRARAGDPRPGGKCVLDQERATTPTRPTRPSLPDLAIQSVTFDPVTRVPTIIILNQGTASTPSYTGPEEFPNDAPRVNWEFFNATGGLYEGRNGERAFGISSALSPGATQTLLPPAMDSVLPGSVRLRVTLDYREQVIESNENNNVWEGDLPPPPPTLPDLRIQSITLNPTTPNVGQPVEVNFVVENSGADLPISSTLAFHHRLRIDVNNDGTWDIVPEISLPIGPGFGDPMPAGATASRWWTSMRISGVDRPIWTATSGTHLVEVCTDTFTSSTYTNRVTELDENNNCLTQSITVAPAVVQLPDLHNRFERIPDTPTEGAPFTLRVQVQNLGTADAGPSTSGLQLDLSNDGDFDETLPTRTIPAITAGATAEAVEWSWSAWPSGGPHRLVTCADSGSAVTESDEGNNCSTIVIVANPAGPIPSEEAVNRLRYALSTTSPSGASIPGLNEVLRFTVSTPGTADGDGVLPGLSVWINSTDNNGVGSSGGDWNTWQSSTETFGLRGADFALYDVTDLSTPISGIWDLYSSGGQLLDDDSETATVVIAAGNIFTSPILISRGTSRTFVLKMDSMGASSNMDDMLRITIPAVVGRSNGLPVVGGTIIY